MGRQKKSIEWKVNEAILWRLPAKNESTDASKFCRINYEIIITQSQACPFYYQTR